MEQIKYTAGYKYQLEEQYRVTLPWVPDELVVTEFIQLWRDGLLLIDAGYAWDGPSGPTIDTKSFMRGSLVHDALYQLMREKKLPYDPWRQRADETLCAICKEDGMGWLRAHYIYRAVRDFAGGAALPKNDKPIITAP